jgi:hypothetical protein
MPAPSLVRVRRAARGVGTVLAFSTAVLLASTAAPART